MEKEWNAHIRQLQPSVSLVVVVDKSDQEIRQRLHKTRKSSQVKQYIYKKVVGSGNYKNTEAGTTPRSGYQNWIIIINEATEAAAQTAAAAKDRCNRCGLAVGGGGGG